MNRLYADEATINYFLKYTKLSYYKISKDTGIHERTISRLSKGDLNIENITFKTASILTRYAVEQPMFKNWQT